MKNLSSSSPIEYERNEVDSVRGLTRPNCEGLNQGLYLTQASSAMKIQIE